MVSLGKAFRPSRKRIAAPGGEEVYEEMAFQVNSWKLQEYLDAIACDKFFQHFLSNLTPHEDSNRLVARNALGDSPDFSKAAVGVRVVSADKLTKLGTRSMLFAQ